MFVTRKDAIGVTLLELLIVVIIVAILASIAFVNFGSNKDAVYEKEAKTNLKLIASAQKIYRLETTFYAPADDATEANSRLKLSLPIDNPNWYYKINSATSSNFIGKAGRAPDNSTVWCIDSTTDDPYSCSAW